MFDNFTHDEEVEIPDDGTELVTSMDVTGWAPCPSTWCSPTSSTPPCRFVTIDNFNGYRAVVWNRTASLSADNVVYAFPSDDMANGWYNVRVIDEVLARPVCRLNLYMTSNWTDDTARVFLGSGLLGTVQRAARVREKAMRRLDLGIAAKSRGPLRRCAAPHGYVSAARPLGLSSLQHCQGARQRGQKGSGAGTARGPLTARRRRRTRGSHRLR